MTGPSSPVAGVLARMRGTPLGAKVALLSAAVTALVVGLAFGVLRLRTEADLRQVFVAELNAGQAAMRHLQDRNLRLLLATSSLVSTSPTLRAALQTQRGEAGAGISRPDLLATIQREAERIFGDLDRDLLIVTDDSGRVMASVGARDAPRPGEPLLRLAAVHNALLSATPTADSGFGVLRLTSGPLQVGCVAILVDGFPIGALLLGERVDHFMPSPVAGADIRTVVTAGDVVLASNLARAPVGAPWALPASPTAGPAQTVTLGGEEYVTASLPLGLADDGRSATLYLMRPLSATLGPIARALEKRFLLTGLLAVLLAGAGGVAVSRTTLRPLSRFVAFMRSGAAAETSARYHDAAAPAEIATLTDAYNRLIESLGRERHELEQRTIELATTNATLGQQVQERERAERALHDSEEQLRQSQKLEALGSLAGGIAHDFNNLLSVILGYADLTIGELPPDSRHREDIGEISQAGLRAKALVHQLLAFSRKQVLQPQILDLNRVVKDMQGLLLPLIGEDVVVETRLEPGLARIMADPGQIEQVILNLAVNARDAMPNGGTLTIATANVVLEEHGAGLPLAAGPSVMLAVRDTGMGMDAATRQRIFEPFFTTKPVGKGTGLGLATVYGVVRQSEGNITVVSQPGQGTTFRCYFPPATEPARAAPAQAHPADAVAGTETILIAEDEGQVRALMRRGLQRRGYTVLEASHGTEAMELAAGYTGPIDVLVTDMVMPFVSGKELAERLQEARPALRVVFISGHSDEAIRRHGMLAAGSVFLQKPVVPDALARVVREVLDMAPALAGEA